MPRRREGPRGGPGPRGAELSSRAGKPPRPRRGWGDRGARCPLPPPPAPTAAAEKRSGRQRETRTGAGPCGRARAHPLPFFAPGGRGRFAAPGRAGASDSPGHGSISLRRRSSLAEPPPPAENALAPSLRPGLATADRRLATAEAPAPHRPASATRAGLRQSERRGAGERQRGWPMDLEHLGKLTGPRQAEGAGTGRAPSV